MLGEEALGSLTLSNRVTELVRGAGGGFGEEVTTELPSER